MIDRTIINRYTTIPVIVDPEEPPVPVDPFISEVEVIADTPNAYEAWPQTTSDSLGNLYIVYRTASTLVHDYAPTGKVVLRISEDNGATWGNEIVVADDLADNDERNPAIIVFNDLGNETIMVVYNEYTATLESTVFVKKALVSNPTVWSEKITVSHNIIRGRSRGNPILLSTGKILIPWQSLQGSVWIGESSDNGLTWDNYMVTNVYTQEITILEVKENGIYQGKIIAFIRRNVSPYGFFKTTSYDYGHTWDDLTVEAIVTTDYETCCQMLRWSNDTLLCVSSHNYKITLYKSENEGVSWEYFGDLFYPTTLPSSYYPSIVKISNKIIGVTWCNNGVNSNVYFNTASFPPIQT